MTKHRNFTGAFYQTFGKRERNSDILAKLFANLVPEFETKYSDTWLPSKQVPSTSNCSILLEELTKANTNLPTAEVLTALLMKMNLVLRLLLKIVPWWWVWFLQWQKEEAGLIMVVSSIEYSSNGIGSLRLLLLFWLPTMMVLTAAMEEMMVVSDGGC